MILLFNLNNYVGGGETLLIRLAQYLQDRLIPYQILCAGGHCWIAREADRLGLKYNIWPLKSDSVNYQDKKDRELTVQALSRIYSNITELRVFTFCMRDLHNALYIFCRMRSSKVYFSHGIYHPEDVFFLSSLSVNPEKFINFNRQLSRILHHHRSILFVNQNGLKISLSPDAPCAPELVSNSCFAPLPISVPDSLSVRELPRNKPVKIICISRFVQFKIGAVLAIMRYVASHSNIELLVIGHGSGKILLDLWLAVRGVKNIKIVTRVEPHQLDELIDLCHIGYAQGTSILEIAKRGLPVLVAPYSRIRDLFNPQFPTLGIFGDIKDGTAFGDITNLSNHITYKISDKVDEVVRNYGYYQKQSVDFVKSFSTEIVCKSILDFIDKSQLNNQQLEFSPPRAPLIKRLLRKVSVKF